MHFRALVVAGVRLLVAVRVRRRGGSSVSAIGRLRLVRVVPVGRVGADGRAGVGRVAAGARVDVGAADGGCGGRTGAKGAELGVGGRGVAVALPEGAALAAAARGVVVGGRGAEALLFLDAARKPELAEGGEEEEETGLLVNIMVEIWGL